MLADFLGIDKTKVSRLRAENGFTWHEANDGRTIQFVVSDINKLFGHLGGISEL